MIITEVNSLDEGGPLFRSDCAQFYWDGKRLRPFNEEAKTANERRKLHWRGRFALWLGKHVRRWERG